jgi:alkylation response protein AidB-like acyl-CoA dehydrogenase
MATFALDEEQQLIVDTVKSFAKNKLRPAMRTAEREGKPSAALYREYNDLQLSTLDFPAAVGGAGLGPIIGALVGEEMAFGDGALAVSLHSPGAFDTALFTFGSPAQQESHLPSFVKDSTYRATAAFSDLTPSATPGLTTRAVKDGAGWRLTGKKHLVTFGESASLVAVFAQIDPAAGWDGVGAFVVERKELQSSGKKRMLGLGSVDFSQLSFEGVYVSDDARFAMPDGARKSLRNFFARSQLRAASRLVGIARAAYEYALEFTTGRHAFGKPVAHFQGVAFMLSDMLMDVESMRWLCWRAATVLEANQRAYKECAQAFSHCADYGQRVAERAVQLLGGAGYVQDHPVEKWMRDAKMISLMGGSPEAARIIVAEEELGRGDSAPLDDLLPVADIQPVIL